MSELFSGAKGATPGGGTESYSTWLCVFFLRVLQ